MDVSIQTRLPGCSVCAPGSQDLQAGLSEESVEDFLRTFVHVVSQALLHLLEPARAPMARGGPHLPPWAAGKLHTVHTYNFQVSSSSSESENSSNNETKASEKQRQTHRPTEGAGTPTTLGSPVPSGNTFPVWFQPNKVDFYP